MLRLHLADHSPPVEDHDPVGHGEQLFQVAGEQHNAGALLLGPDDLLPDGPGGLDIQSPGGIGADKDLGRVFQFPSQDELLQVAAGQVGTALLAAGGADVKGLHGRRGLGLDSFQVRQTVLFRIVGVPEEPVFIQGKIRHRAHRVAVGGHIAHPRLDKGGGPVHLLPINGDFAGRGGAHPRQHLGQLVLAVALHPGDAHDLAPADGEVHAVEGLDAPVVPGLQRRAGHDGLRHGRLFHIGGQVRQIVAGHHPHNLVLVGPGGLRLPGHPTVG